MFAVLAGGNAGLLAFEPFFLSFSRKTFLSPQDKSAYYAAVSSVISPQFVKELQHCALDESSEDVDALMYTVYYYRMLSHF